MDGSGELIAAAGEGRPQTTRLLSPPSPPLPQPTLPSLEARGSGDPQPETDVEHPLVGLDRRLRQPATQSRIVGACGASLLVALFFTLVMSLRVPAKTRSFVDSAVAAVDFAADLYFAKRARSLIAGTRPDGYSLLVGAANGIQHGSEQGEVFAALRVSSGTELDDDEKVGYVALRHDRACGEFNLKHVATPEECHVAAVALNLSSSQVDLYLVQQESVCPQLFLQAASVEVMDDSRPKPRCFAERSRAVWARQIACRRRLDTGGKATPSDAAMVICSNRSQAIVTTPLVVTGAPVSSARPVQDALSETFSTTVTETTTSSVVCEDCTPRKLERPTVVIPFYERDLCKLLVTAKSIGVMDPQKLLGDIILMWISFVPLYKYSMEIKEIEDTLLQTHNVNVFDFNGVMNKDMSGWYTQQVLKLKVSALVHSDYYLVMDAKNTIIKKITPTTFFGSCGRATTFGRFDWKTIPGLHGEWYNTSSQLLEVKPPHAGDENFPTSITPMMLHRDTVKELLADLGERADPYLGLCDGLLCKIILQGATEFTLYQMFARRKTRHECYHVVHPIEKSMEPEASLWRGEGNRVGSSAWQFAKWNLATTKRIAEEIASGSGATIVFGAQDGALNAMSGQQYYEELQELSKIYQATGLFDPTESWDALSACVVGGKE